MSLAPSSVSAIPEETSRIARAAFPSPSRCMQMRDQLGAIYDDATFAELYPRRGQPAEAPWRLGFVTLMQFADSLSDRQAAEAEPLLLDALIEQLQACGWLKAGGRARTDSTYVLAAIRTLNRLEGMGETLRAALNDLAVVAPEW